MPRLVFPADEERPEMFRVSRVKAVDKMHRVYSVEPEGQL